MNATELSFFGHLVEFRNRVLRIVAFILVIFLGLSIYANEIYDIIAAPLTKNLPINSSMIAIDVASPLLTPFKLAGVAAVFLSVPFILYQFWAFVAPALYKEEQRAIFPLIIASTILFYSGILFAYFVVFPIMLGFLTATAPTGVTVMTDIAKYLDFVLTMFFAFGVCFEIPIFTLVLVKTETVSIEKLKEQRPYVIVGAFVIGMFLTPPDVISQTLLALPMWFLFELGLIGAILTTRKKTNQTELSSVKHQPRFSKKKKR